MNQKGFSTTIIVVAVVIILAGGIGYLMWTKKPPVNSKGQSAQESKSDTDSWPISKHKQYRSSNSNDGYISYQFKYPPTLIQEISEIPQSSGLGGLENEYYAKYGIFQIKKAAPVRVPGILVTHGIPFIRELGLIHSWQEGSVIDLIDNDIQLKKDQPRMRSIIHAVLNHIDSISASNFCRELSASAEEHVKHFSLSEQDRDKIFELYKNEGGIKNLNRKGKVLYCDTDHGKKIVEYGIHHDLVPSSNNPSYRISLNVIKFLPRQAGSDVSTFQTSVTIDGNDTSSIETLRNWLRLMTQSFTVTN